MMKLRSRKGESSIVATLILTAVVIAIGITLLGYFSGTNAIRQTEYFDQTLESVQKIEERFCIEKIGVDNGHVTLWVYNYGKDSINITRVGVNQWSGQASWTIGPGSASSKQFSTGLSMPVGSMVYVEVSSSRLNKAKDVAKIQ